jgi:hypothetical protein
VVVPPPEEFQGRTVVLSAATVERRIHRLLAAGELPSMRACMRCGQERDVETVNLLVDCEQSEVRTSGGWTVNWSPLPFVDVPVWKEELHVEVLGRDTIIPAPLALCPDCTRVLPCPKGRVDLAAAAAVIALSVFVGYYSWVAGLATGLLGLAAILWRRQRRWVRWQRDLRALLRKVPAYGQLLDMYPFALVGFP